MAQGDRPRHYRQSSRIPRPTTSADESGTEWNKAYKKSVKDQATIKFIKRVLCQSPAQSGPTEKTLTNNTESTPLHELLPPLTSSNDVDVQLYAIIAVILSQFVQSWYNRFTPDQDFVKDVVRIIAHCTRGLEQRLRHVDLEELLLDELPALLVTHVDAVTVARSACFDDRSQGDVRMIYHSIRPINALTPLPVGEAALLEQDNNEIAWSQLLVSRILPLVLPPEDLQNPCLHVLVSEIFSEMIVHRAVCGRASEAWLLWEGVTKLIKALRPDYSPRQSADEISPPINKLEQFGLLPKATEGQDLRNVQRGMLDNTAQVFWSVLQVIMIAWLVLRSFATALMHASSIPARHSRVEELERSDKVHVSAVTPESRPSPQHTILGSRDKRPVISLKVWTCISRLTAIEQRMPWLSGFLSLLQWLSLHGPGSICRTNSVLDRLMSSKINAELSRPDLLPSVLQAIRGALFPDNALAAAKVPPTSAETAEIKRECAKTIVYTIPTMIRDRFFGTKDQDLMRQDVESTLDLLADSYINKHLIISAVELIVVRLFPELADDGAEEQQTWH